MSEPYSTGQKLFSDEVSKPCIKCGKDSFFYGGNRYHFWQCSSCKYVFYAEDKDFEDLIDYSLLPEDEDLDYQPLNEFPDFQ